LRRLTLNVIVDLEGICPPLTEQRAIAAFLNHETARINALVAKKECLIKLLQEKRAALISHAVTKGIDPDVKMKDSGVEWLGEIPQHWEVRRLRFVGAFYSGGTPSKENLDFWSGDIPWVSPKDMKYEIIRDTEDHITTKAIEDSSTRLVQAWAVLIVVRSGILRHTIPVGINAIPVAINQDMKAVVLKPFLRAEYFASVIRGHQSILLIEWRKEGTTVESIEFDLLVNTSCPIPPIAEQEAIISYIERETARIDALISKIGEAIEKLKEYSSALISAAVTGKIDVRETVSDHEE
jgi:type I restriction enzyme, S subunit